MVAGSDTAFHERGEHDLKGIPGSGGSMRLPEEVIRFRALSGLA